MTRRLFVIPAVALILGCGLRIRISEEASTVVRKGSVVEGLLGDFGFGSFLDMDLTEAQELRNQGVEPGDITNVRMVSFELEATSPDGGDLAFITSLELYVEAPGLPRELLAYQDVFPAGQAVVQLELPDLDLTDYVVSESMSITTAVTGRRPDVDTDIAARFALTVVARPAAACN